MPCCPIPQPGPFTRSALPDAKWLSKRYSVVFALGVLSASMIWGIAYRELAVSLQAHGCSVVWTCDGFDKVPVVAVPRAKP